MLSSSTSGGTGSWTPCICQPKCKRTRTPMTSCSISPRRHGGNSFSVLMAQRPARRVASAVMLSIPFPTHSRILFSGAATRCVPACARSGHMPDGPAWTRGVRTPALLMMPPPATRCGGVTAIVLVLAPECSLLSFFLLRDPRPCSPDGAPPPSPRLTS